MRPLFLLLFPHQILLLVLGNSLSHEFFSEVAQVVNQAIKFEERWALDIRKLIVRKFQLPQVLSVLATIVLLSVGP